MPWVRLTVGFTSIDRFLQNMVPIFCLCFDCMFTIGAWPCGMALDPGSLQYDQNINKKSELYSVGNGLPKQNPARSDILSTEFVSLSPSPQPLKIPTTAGYDQTNTHGRLLCTCSLVPHVLYPARPPMYYLYIKVQYSSTYLLTSNITTYSSTSPPSLLAHVVSNARPSRARPYLQESPCHRGRDHFTHRKTGESIRSTFRP